MRMPGTKVGVLLKGQAIAKAEAEAKAKAEAEAKAKKEAEEKAKAAPATPPATPPTPPADNGGDENIPTIIVDDPSSGD